MPTKLVRREPCQSSCLLCIFCSRDEMDMEVEVEEVEAMEVEAEAQK